MTSGRKRNNTPRAVLAALACAPLCAQGAGFYVDAGVGSASVGGIGQQELDALIVAVGEEAFDSFDLNDSSVDKADISFSLALGYRVTQHVAVEAAYIQLGKVGYEADVTVADGGNPPVDLTMGLDFKSSGPAVSLVGILPVGESLALDARAGAYFARTKASVFATDGITSESDSLGSEKDTSLLLGIGATCSLTDKFGLRLGYTRLDKAVADEGDADVFSLAARLSF
jgi:opacity protein-like surface antigen